MVLINSFLYPFVQHLKYEVSITIYRYIDVLYVNAYVYVDDYICVLHFDIL